MPDLRALLVDWGGVLTEPLESAMRSWAEVDGVDFDSYIAVMREWLGEHQSELAAANPVAALERGEIDRFVGIDVLQERAQSGASRCQRRRAGGQRAQETAPRNRTATASARLERNAL